MKKKTILINGIRTEVNVPDSLLKDWNKAKDRNICFTSQLRQEAIKHIKILSIIVKDNGYPKSVRVSNLTVIDCIKDFFNIKEKDLK